ncbi:ABC transporter substrate-binding protein [Mycolicibacterium vaccae]|uniref:Nitrate/sulfonate/bicarbonate ABC transporter periplasmic component-like protein n=1 Tax=Mycolicibacterium vaccae ATCC 25954 TaxID=1194972 RepID=K0US15_MYCVA|nr:ABC transporter substrate-binding protein [Mycolicibacterium vaccae]ANI40401.1 nitrate ABC transporter substrate-binding protein [Mycolicibacterium vaccae 95051]EJZ09877.1 nitrate/sulfonate/bicarbonate ABC transporter periplasmic component-like protein [Mycolicibacterium vaccae ATCC 25954]MCV7060482.1 ABC transporter substrate-binding protein [Mycolicibacterium vaccae]
MYRHLARTALTLAVLSSAVACGSGDDGADGYTLRIGATSPTGTPAGSLGWGDKQGILAEQLKDAGVDKIEYAFFQSGSDVASALFAGAVDVAAIGDNPALRARGKDPKVVLLTLDSINGDAWLVGAKGGPTDIEGLVGKSVTAPQGTIRDRAAKQLIDAAGLNGKIQVRDVPTPESIAGLSSGQIDATVVTGASAIELESKGFPIIDSLSRHGLGSTGTNIALSTFTEEHPEFADAWRQAVTAVNKDIRENFDQYAEWVAQTDGTDVAFVKESTRPDEFNTDPFPAQGVDQLQAAYDFLEADGSLEGQYSVREWAGAQS